MWNVAIHNNLLWIVYIIARSRKDSDLNMRVVHKMEASIFQRDQKHLEEVQINIFSLIINS